MVDYRTRLMNRLININVIKTKREARLNAH